MGFLIAKLIKGLKQANVELDRKILAEIAVADMPAFGQLAQTAKVSPRRLSALRLPVPMNDSLEALRGEVLDRIQQANSEKELEQLRVEVLGRSGTITLLLRGLKELPAEERPRAGEALNQLRREL